MPKGMEWLWHPQIVSLYNRILRQCEINAITREAACGALQNITAGDKRVSGELAAWWFLTEEPSHWVIYKLWGRLLHTLVLNLLGFPLKHCRERWTVDLIGRNQNNGKPPCPMIYMVHLFKEFSSKRNTQISEFMG